MTETDRIIDANANRVCEAFRVLEDLARFALNRADLSARAKDARHTVRRVVGPRGLKARDTPGDVGVSITNDSESRRGDLRDLARANAKRAQEGLRVLEECMKLGSGDASVLERARYDAYELEGALVTGLRPPCPQWRLCVLLTRELCTHHDPERVLEFAALGGAACVQIREKTMPDAVLFPYAERIAARARSLGMHVMVNDRVDLALACGADGVHLGQDDMPTDHARRLLGSGAWIGRSCDSADRVRDAIDAGADCIGVGPVFTSSTKPKDDLGGVALVESCAEICAARETAMLAISGITPGNAHELARVGCPGVAVSGAVCAAEDPRAVSEAIIAALVP